LCFVVVVVAAVMVTVFVDIVKVTTPRNLYQLSPFSGSNVVRKALGY
jgi:hypothetical protein